jgi:hypothetical protein
MTSTTPSTLASTRLFARLEALSHQTHSPLAGNVLQICADASDRLRLFLSLHGQFTLHDEVHCLRIVTLMDALLGPLLDSLNAPELALLILAAYHHDQGMIITAAEVPGIRASDEWRVHEAQWTADHPNRTELIARASDPLLGADQKATIARAIADLEAAMFTDFVRVRHGERSAHYVRVTYTADPRLVIGGRALADVLAKVCHSHVLPTNAITLAGGFSYDDLFGTETANVAFVSYVLRLADALDFTRDRTPDALYRAIDFTSGISLLEWEKHRCIVGWEIEPNRIAFAAECSHPAYERAVRQFLALVEVELTALNEWNRLLPAAFTRYRLDLPTRIDAAKVGPTTDASTGKPTYIYHDLEFTLARDQLVKLLMTSELYNSTSLFVRELLQNALDALRHRNAIYRMEGAAPPGLTVLLEHFQDVSGFDVVRCTDNGIGMDTATVTDFLSRVGHSYYRSPAFERERARFRDAGCDFDPCARFGIGFMSCFMFGDDIVIRTRRETGVGSSAAESLVVEITGLSGIVTIRPGTPDQPVGTAVEVRARRNQFIVDEHDDPVHLIEVVSGYALATEYPIRAACTVAGIAGEVVIPTTFQARPHILEEISIGATHTFVREMGDGTADLRGQIRLCTLIDPDGLVTVSNPDAVMSVRQQPKPSVDTETVFTLRNGTVVVRPLTREHSQVCADGILIAGEPGREGRTHHLGYQSSPLHLGSASSLVDARGSLKPTLTPARTVPNHRFEPDHTWARLQSAVGREYGHLLSEILSRCDPANDPMRFLLAVEAYDLDLALLPLAAIWEHVRLPVRRPSGDLAWRSMRDIGRGSLTFFEVKPEIGAWSWTLALESGDVFTIPPEIEAFQSPRNARVTTGLLEYILIAASRGTLLAPSTIQLAPSPATEDTLSLDDCHLGSWPSMRHFIRLCNDDRRVIVVQGDSGFANVDHPIVQEVLSTSRLRRLERSPLQELLAMLVWAWPHLRTSEAAAADTWTSRNRAKLGKLSLAVDWANVPASLRPPFVAFIPGVGIDSIDHEDLRRWATA